MHVATINDFLDNHNIKLKHVRIEYEVRFDLNLDDIFTYSRDAHLTTIISGNCLIIYINECRIRIYEGGKIVIMYDYHQVLDISDTISKIFSVWHLNIPDNILVTFYDGWVKLRYKNNIDIIKLNRYIKLINLDDFKICNNDVHVIRYLTFDDIRMCKFAKAIIYNDGRVMISSPINQFIPMYYHLYSCAYIYHTFWSLSQTLLLRELISIIINIIVCDI